MCDGAGRVLLCLCDLRDIWGGVSGWVHYTDRTEAARCVAVVGLWVAVDGRVGSAAGVSMAGQWRPALNKN